MKKTFGRGHVRHASGNAASHSGGSFSFKIQSCGNTDINARLPFLVFCLT